MTPNLLRSSPELLFLSNGSLSRPFDQSNLVVMMVIWPKCQRKILLRGASLVPGRACWGHRRFASRMGGNILNVLDWAFVYYCALHRCGEIADKYSKKLMISGYALNALLPFLIYWFKRLCNYSWFRPAWVLLRRSRAQRSLYAEHENRRQASCQAWRTAIKSW